MKPISFPLFLLLLLSTSSCKKDSATTTQTGDIAYVDFTVDGHSGHYSTYPATTTGPNGDSRSGQAAPVFTGLNSNPNNLFAIGVTSSFISDGTKAEGDGIDLTVKGVTGIGTYTYHFPNSTNDGAYGYHRSAPGSYVPALATGSNTHRYTNSSGGCSEDPLPSDVLVVTLSKYNVTDATHFEMEGSFGGTMYENPLPGSTDCSDAKAHVFSGTFYTHMNH